MAFVAYETPALPYSQLLELLLSPRSKLVVLRAIPAQVTFSGTLTAGSNVSSPIIAAMPTGLNADNNAAYATGIPNQAAIRERRHQYRDAERAGNDLEARV